MITRVRIESSAKTENEVRDELVAFAGSVPLACGGQWLEEEPGIQIQTTSTGFWGRFTMRRDT